MAKVLFISPYFAPDYASSSPFYAAFAEDLASSGHDVTVVTGMPHIGRDRVWEEYTGKYLVDERENGYRVVRVYAYVANKNKIFGRLFAWTLFNILATAVSPKLGHQDVLFASNPFMLSALPLYVIGAWERAPVIYSVEDIYPDAGIRSGLIRGRHLPRWVGYFESCCYERARYIRVLSEGMRRVLTGRGVPDEKVVTIPNFADTELVRPLPRRNEFSTLHSLDDKFVALYSGNMSQFHGLEIVLEAAERLRNRAEIVFLMVGEGRARGALEESARNLGLSNIMFLPFQPQENVPAVLATADVSLVTLAKGFVSESVPSKTYNILASGRPLLASVSAENELSEIISESRCGTRVDAGDGEALGKAILEIHGNQLVREQMGKRAREYVVAHYSRQATFAKLRGLVDECGALKRRAL
jgi:colanic acid biosynthesis glycosyl transferase WcaI